MSHGRDDWDPPKVPEETREHLRLVPLYREAGHVERCHTVPHHGAYSVGKHSWDAATLLLLLNPSPSLELVKAMLWHDVPERWTGDAPATAKWNSAALAVAHRELEALISPRIGLPDTSRLTPDERNWLGAIDRLELWLWAWEQGFLGNRNADRVRWNVEAWFSRKRTEGIIPAAVDDFMKHYHHNRTRDELP